MAGVGAGSLTTIGVMPWAARMSAAKATKLSPRKRGSRPTITRAPDGLSELTWRAIPTTARRIFSKVNSSAMMARQPEVPNLICTFIKFQANRGAKRRFRLPWSLAIVRGQWIVQAEQELSLMTDKRIVLTTIGSRREDEG